MKGILNLYVLKYEWISAVIRISFHRFSIFLGTSLAVSSQHKKYTKPTTHPHPCNVPRQITSPSKSSKECTPMAQGMHDKLLGQWHVCLCLCVCWEIFTCCRVLVCFWDRWGGPVTCSFAGWMISIRRLDEACMLHAVEYLHSGWNFAIAKFEEGNLKNT